MLLFDLLILVLINLLIRLWIPILGLTARYGYGTFCALLGGGGQMAYKSLEAREFLIEVFNIVYLLYFIFIFVALLIEWWFGFMNDLIFVSNPLCRRETFLAWTICKCEFMQFALQILWA